MTVTSRSIPFSPSFILLENMVMVQVYVRGLFTNVKISSRIPRCKINSHARDQDKNSVCERYARATSNSFSYVMALDTTATLGIQCCWRRWISCVRKELASTRNSKAHRLQVMLCTILVRLLQLVVVDDQSSGKSSVLEGLTKLPFPGDSTLCTRFATQIVFRRAERESIAVSIIPSPSSDAARE